MLLFINRQDSNVIDGMFGTLSKFNFIPLLCASGLYIIGECFRTTNSDKDAPYILSLIFSAIGLGCLIPIYLKTNLTSSPIYIRLAIKKGLYPCLISLFVYNFCYTFNLYGFLKKKDDVIIHGFIFINHKENDCNRKYFYNNSYNSFCISIQLFSYDFW